MTGPYVQKQTGADRLVWECSVCKGRVDVPNKGMGRAVVAAWKTQHQHNELTPGLLMPSSRKVGGDHDE